MTIKNLSLFKGEFSLEAISHLLGTENYDVNDELIRSFRTRGEEGYRFLLKHLTDDKKTRESWGLYVN